MHGYGRIISDYSAIMFTFLHGCRPVCLTCSQYVVKAKGRSFADCGVVDARVAKRQRHEGANDACPISVQMIDEYDAYVKKFKVETRDHTVDGGELDIGERGCPALSSFLILPDLN